MGSLHALILARLIEVLNPYAFVTKDEVNDALAAVALYTIPLIVGMMILSCLQSYLITAATAQLEFSLRTKLFNAIIGHDLASFESNPDIKGLPGQI